MCCNLAHLGFFFASLNFLVMKYRLKVKQKTEKVKNQKRRVTDYSLRKEKAWHLLFLYLECRMKAWWD